MRYELLWYNGWNVNYMWGIHWCCSCRYSVLSKQILHMGLRTLDFFSFVGCFRSRSKYFAYKWRCQHCRWWVPMKDFDRHPDLCSCKEGSLSCHTYCDTGPRLCGLNFRTTPIKSPFMTSTGCWWPVLTWISTRLFWARNYPTQMIYTNTYKHVYGNVVFYLLETRKSFKIRMSQLWCIRKF